MPDQQPPYEFSTDPARLDAGWIHTVLSEHAYWARGRPRDVQDRANAASRCYGVYQVSDGSQVAFARLVTDGATFGWLCDVIVDPEHRGRGIGTMLMAGVVAEIEPLGLRKTLLATDDAHGLYAKFGWGLLHSPESWMERPA